MKNREYTGKTNFIDWDFGDYEDLKLRIVRFKISDNSYETIFTSLPRNKFSIEDIICKTTLGDSVLHGKIYYSESYVMY